jgi:EPS-associated MarR family transcriptional regulator
MSERNLDDATRYELLKLLEEEPRLSQRELAERMGVSLGKVNYCLRAVLARGHAKAINFRNSRNRVAYLYKLTPAGIAAKLRVTRRFLELKQAEYASLSKEIERLRLEVEDDDTL